MSSQHNQTQLGQHSIDQELERAVISQTHVTTQDFSLLNHNLRGPTTVFVSEVATEISLSMILFPLRVDQT